MSPWNGGRPDVARRRQPLDGVTSTTTLTRSTVPSDAAAIEPDELPVQPVVLAETSADVEADERTAASVVPGSPGDAILFLVALATNARPPWPPTVGGEREVGRAPAGGGPSGQHGGRNRAGELRNELPLASGPRAMWRWPSGLIPLEFGGWPRGIPGHSCRVGMPFSDHGEGCMTTSDPGSRLLVSPDARAFVDRIGRRAELETMIDRAGKCRARLEVDRGRA